MSEAGWLAPHIALMSFVKWLEREISPPCDFRWERGSDDRATVEAKPEDVGDQALIRVFNRSSEFRPGLSAVYARASIF
jgi:hypothetical protein